MFLIRNGRDSFFAPAFSGSGYRFDPGCMTACDMRSNQVALHFASAFDRATEHQWTAGGQLLLIDNGSALHARSAVAEGDTDRELTRVAFLTSETR
jgi:hypothetical protein